MNPFFIKTHQNPFQLLRLQSKGRNEYAPAEDWLFLAFTPRTSNFRLGMLFICLPYQRDALQQLLASCLTQAHLRWSSFLLLFSFLLLRCPYSSSLSSRYHWSGLLFICLTYRRDALQRLLASFLTEIHLRWFCFCSSSSPFSSSVAAYSSSLSSLGIAIVTGEEANSGKSRNGPLAGLRNDTNSITPYSADRQMCGNYPPLPVYNISTTIEVVLPYKIFKSTNVQLGLGSSDYYWPGTSFNQ